MQLPLFSLFLLDCVITQDMALGASVSLVFFFLSADQLESNHPGEHHLQALFSNYSLLLDTVSYRTKEDSKYSHLSV